MRLIIPDILNNFSTINMDRSIIVDRQSLDIFNEYIPLIALRSGELTRQAEKKIFSYHLALFSEQNSTNRMEAFCDHLKTGTNWIKAKHRNFTKDYFGTYGTIIYMDENMRLVPLMVLCVKRYYLYHLNRETPDPKHFCLLVDRKFYGDPEHYKLFRNVNRLFLPEIKEQIDVIESNEISDLCFNPGNDIAPKYKTVVDMLNDLKNINKLVQMEFAEPLNSNNEPR